MAGRHQCTAQMNRVDEEGFCARTGASDGGEISGEDVRTAYPAEDRVRHDSWLPDRQAHVARWIADRPSRIARGSLAGSERGQRIGDAARKPAVGQRRWERRRDIAARAEDRV